MPGSRVAWHVSQRAAGACVFPTVIGRVSGHASGPIAEAAHSLARAVLTSGSNPDWGVAVTAALTGERDSGLSGHRVRSRLFGAGSDQRDDVDNNDGGDGLDGIGMLRTREGRRSEARVLFGDGGGEEGRG